MRTPQSNMAISEALHALIHLRRSLSEEESEQAMHAILEGNATEAQMAAFLVALHLKGENAAELTGAARALRAAAHTPPYSSLAESKLLDTCGTGGDHSGTFNISTVTAFVVAGAGVRVAKHGNRSLSSVCGSADLLEALGVNLAHASTTLESAGIAFYFAPLFHTATRHVQPVRSQLKMRTIFNYLGPLTNPAGANIQIAGAFSVHAAGLIAQALLALGLPRGFVVSGGDGLDEVTTTAPTTVFAIENGAITRRSVQPEDFGLRRAPPEAICGGSIERNRDIAIGVLNGKPGFAREIVLANAALALVAADKVATLPDGVRQAAASIDSGAAFLALERLK